RTGDGAGEHARNRNAAGWHGRQPQETAMETRKRLFSSLILGAAVTGILAGSAFIAGCGKANATESNGCGGPNGCGGKNGCNGQHGQNGCNGQHGGAESRKAEAIKK